MTRLLQSCLDYHGWKSPGGKPQLRLVTSPHTLTAALSVSSSVFFMFTVDLVLVFVKLKLAHAWVSSKLDSLSRVSHLIYIAFHTVFPQAWQKLSFLSPFFFFFFFFSFFQFFGYSTEVHLKLTWMSQNLGQLMKTAPLSLPILKYGTLLLSLLFLQRGRDTSSNHFEAAAGPHHLDAVTGNNVHEDYLTAHLKKCIPALVMNLTCGFSY